MKKQLPRLARQGSDHSNATVAVSKWLPHGTVDPTIGLLPS